LTGSVAQKSISDYSTGNSDWVCTGTIDRYNTGGQPEQTTNAAGVHGTRVFRNDVVLPVGSISNASFGESGIFTGDYDAGGAADPAYFDYENGWQKGSAYAGGVIELNTTAHFGEKSLHVRNGYAPVKSFKIDRTKDYLFSAWVRAATGTTNIRFGVELHAADANGNLGAWIAAYDFMDEGFAADEWHFVKNRIKASDLASHMQSGHNANEVAYYLVWIGKNSSDAFTVDFNVDDIRFYPADAIVTTTFYDSKWRQPIMSVDANGNPGYKTVYDDFGRPIEQRNIDKYNPSNTKLISSKKYHLMDDCSTPDYFNDYEAGNLDIVNEYSECGSPGSIVTAGYNSAHAIKLSNTDVNCGFAHKLTISAYPYAGKMGVLKGYYKAEKPVAIGITATSTGHSAPVGGADLPITNEWTPFSVYFDLRSLESTATNLDIRFINNNNMDAVYFYWIDDLSVCALY
jgi:hypothetical protein